METLLDGANITCNKNPIPFDAKHPAEWKGVQGKFTFNALGGALQSQTVVTLVPGQQFANFSTMWPLNDTSP